MAVFCRPGGLPPTCGCGAAHAPVRLGWHYPTENRFRGCVRRRHRPCWRCRGLGGRPFRWYSRPTTKAGEREAWLATVTHRSDALTGWTCATSGPARRRALRPGSRAQRAFGRSNRGWRGLRRDAGYCKGFRPSPWTARNPENAQMRAAPNKKTTAGGTKIMPSCQKRRCITSVSRGAR
jgi:hypothetical protein